MSESLQIDRQGRVLHLALNRPEKRNALNMELCSALGAALDAAESDSSVGAILLSGNGKSFCAGMDLREAQPSAGEINAAHERIFSAGMHLTKPLIAAVHGAALAGGTGLVANCHVAIAAEDATFGLTEIRIGLWPFVIFRAMEASLGQRRATELALSGRTFGALEAREYGLVHQVMSAGGLMARAGEVAVRDRRVQSDGYPGGADVCPRRARQVLGGGRRPGAQDAHRSLPERGFPGGRRGVPGEAGATLDEVGRRVSGTGAGHRTLFCENRC